MGVVNLCFINLAKTTFPRIPSPECFQVSWIIRGILQGIWQVDLKQQPYSLCPGGQHRAQGVAAALCMLAHMLDDLLAHPPLLLLFCLEASLILGSDLCLAL